MAKNNGSNQDFTNNSDGFDLTGGVTRRKLTLSGADVSVVGAGSVVITYPNVATTLAGLTIAQTFTAAQTFNAGISIGASNITTDTVTGMMIGTGTSQRLGFFGKTPIAQPGNTSEIGNLLGNLGLIASAGAFQINTSGNINIIASPKHFI